MDNFEYEIIKININDEEYKIHEKKDLRNGFLSYFLPLSGSEDFDKLIELINVYNPPTNILQNPWNDEFEQVKICDRKYSQKEINLNYRIICELESGFINLNFKTDGKKEYELFARKYTMILVKQILEKKKDKLNDEKNIKY